MPSKNHAHKYMRTKVRNRPVFRCMESDCSHYILPALIVNRRAKCWYCDKEFIITQDLARRKRIRCNDCVERRTKIKIDDTMNFLEELGKDTEV